MKDWQTTIIGLIAQAVAILVGVEIFSADTGSLINEIAMFVVLQAGAVIAFIAEDKKTPDSWKQFLGGLLVTVVSILVALNVSPELVDQIDKVGWLVIGFIGLALGGTADLPEKFKSKTTP